MNYFLVNKLFSPRQFGFIPGRSTSLQLLNLIDKWTKSLENGGQIDIIYTDLRKHSIRFCIDGCSVNYIHMEFMLISSIGLNNFYVTVNIKFELMVNTHNGWMSEAVFLRAAF